jgi:DNA-binding transcriptional LysR family regulator
MERDLLGHLPVVLAVARRGGFAVAAAELGMSPSAVSHAVRFVEERIGVPLFVRTTRSVALTEAGAALIEGMAPAFDDIGERIERIRAAKGRVSGLLRLNVPSVALPMMVNRLAKAMAERFPDLTLELFTDNAITDIVADGFDAGIRLGEMIAEDMVAVRLTPPFEAVVVASPDYLAAHGMPLSVADLGRHNTIGYRQIKAGGLYRWELRDDGRDVVLETTGRTIVNDARHARELALAGIGLAYVFEPLVRADVAAGRLVRVVPESAIVEPGLFLYYPRRSSLAPKLRALIDTARELART